ncbi:GNAT family N-acetyltransferase [Ampullimonas aquatilis]|uniref:GNAT family N-acetyltransferase n=1 Tax=Ampullimonas aquatilis TaxID=1341549 RepID=UPI003C788161
MSSPISIRLMQKTDLAAADKVVRLAFGTFLGAPDPANFMGDVSYVKPRWLINPNAAFVAVKEHVVIGSCFATHWGSFGFFGPLTVHPDYWNQGVAQLLLEPILEKFEQWQVTNAGLFTFPNSVKHLSLYQRYDFWPQHLTAIMSKSLLPMQPVTTAKWNTFSAVPEHQQEAYLMMCRDVCDSILYDLDLSHEITSTLQFKLGETILLWEQDLLIGFAICQHGAGTEAGTDGGKGHCYVKFACVRTGDHVERDFPHLLEAIEAYARGRKLQRISAGVNTARLGAYHRLLAQEFRIDFLGLAMQYNQDPGYCRPDVYALDDWR